MPRKSTRIAVVYILLSIIAAMVLFERRRRRRPFAYGAFEFAIGLIGAGIGPAPLMLRIAS